MRQLNLDQYQTVYPFFPANFPNSPIIHAIIERKIPGQIWADNIAHPTLCLILTGISYCFIKGKLTKKIFQDCLKILNQKTLIKLALDPTPEFDLSEFGFSPVARRQYRYQDIHTEIPVYENTSGFELKKISDTHTFNACLWKDLITGFFGTAENFLKNGTGYILWDTKNQIIASEAYGIPSQHLVEVGTITHEHYRGQKLSTMLCNHLIRHALKENLQPVWTCDEANTISWKVAEKQGMNDLMRYTFYVKSPS